ncbi:IQCH protein, partial [Polyodon spathula]|nr:IQCH protein [Polyodon spathula]
VQEALCHLKNNITRITIQRSGEVIDIQALETAIQRTENGLRKHAEEYLNTVNNQILTLPSIDETGVILNVFDCICNIKHEFFSDFLGSLSLKLCVIEGHWPLQPTAHLENRFIQHYFPLSQHKHATNAQLQKISRGPTVGNLSVVPAAYHNNPYLVPSVPNSEGKKVRPRTMPLRSRDEKHTTALTELVMGLELDIPPAPEYLVSVLENFVDVWELMHGPGQRYKGMGGVGMAAVKIQSSRRRHHVRAAYLEYRRQKWAAGAIAISWLLHAQMVRMKKALKGSHQRHLENFRSRAKVCRVTSCYASASFSSISASVLPQSCACPCLCTCPSVIFHSSSEIQPLWLRKKPVTDFPSKNGLNI